MGTLEDEYFEEDMENMDTYIYAKYAEMTLAKLTSKKDDDLHMIMGIATEAGELMDVYKKNHAYGKDIDIYNVREEIGDLMWYIINLCNLHGWDITDIMRTNIRKLRERYPNKFNQEDALNRDLVAERKILES